MIRNQKCVENRSKIKKLYAITEIKRLTRKKLKDFRQIKQNYTYAESQILVNRDEIKPKKLPSSRKASRTEVLSYQKIQKSFLEKITKFIDQETIQFQILRHKSAQSKKWLTNYPTKNTQPLIPLANQLFKNSLSDQPAVKSGENNFANESEHVSSEIADSLNETIDLDKKELPDWI